MLSLPASWLSGSAFILRIRVQMQDHQPAALGLPSPQWSVRQALIVGLNSCSDAVNEHRPKCEEGTIIVTHAAKSITQQALPCPSLWDTLQEEETDNGHRVSKVLHWEKIFWRHNNSTCLHPSGHSKCSEKSKLTEAMNNRGLPLFS